MPGEKNQLYSVLYTIHKDAVDFLQPLVYD